jgi:hypothetical protein
MKLQIIFFYSFLLALTIYAFFFTPSSAAFSVSFGYSLMKYTILLSFVAFTFYTIYVTTKENIFKTVKRIFTFHWGRQILLDLYIGLFLFGFLVFLVEKSWIMVLIWMIPALIFGNIIPLLYFASQFDRIFVFFAA